MPIAKPNKKIQKVPGVRNMPAEVRRLILIKYGLTSPRAAMNMILAAQKNKKSQNYAMGMVLKLALVRNYGVYEPVIGGDIVTIPLKYGELKLQRYKLHAPADTNLEWEDFIHVKGVLMNGKLKCTYDGRIITFLIPVGSKRPSQAVIHAVYLGIAYGIAKYAQNLSDAIREHNTTGMFEVTQENMRRLIPTPNTRIDFIFEAPPPETTVAKNFF